MYLKYWKLTAFTVLFAVLYILESVLVKPDAATLEKYHITASQAAMLSLTIALPYLIIWFIALSGYLHLNKYTDSISKGKDGAAFKLIRRGVFWLFIWLPISAVAGAVSTQLYHLHPEMTANLTRLNIYLNIGLLLPGFYLINRGSQKLRDLVKSNAQCPSQKATFFYLGFAALYTALVVSDPAAQQATATTSVAAYYMPDWIIVTTVVIPRLIMWYLGIQAVAYIYAYQQKVKGVLYKSALRNFAHGVAGVVLLTIVLRCIQSLSSQLGELSLGLLLLVIYLLLLIIGIAYKLLANGSKRLLEIEKV